MLDLIVFGGTCVLPSGTTAADIGVKDGLIAVVGGPGTLAEAERRVDATGRLVIPGGIDPHIHCSMPVRAPGRPDVLTDPPSQVSKAALHGGTTTLIDFVQCVHDRTSRLVFIVRDLEPDEIFRRFSDGSPEGVT